MNVRADTLLVSFIVALLSSFLIALAVLLLKTLSISAFNARLFADITINLLILIFFSIFIFIRGSMIAAWLLYRHDVPWGYKLEFKKVVPILGLSFLMAISLFFAVYYYSTGKLTELALQYTLETLSKTKRM